MQSRSNIWSSEKNQTGLHLPVALADSRVSYPEMFPQRKRKTAVSWAVWGAELLEQRERWSLPCTQQWREIFSVKCRARTEERNIDRLEWVQWKSTKVKKRLIWYMRRDCKRWDWSAWRREGSRGLINKHLMKGLQRRWSQFLLSGSLWWYNRIQAEN